MFLTKRLLPGLILTSTVICSGCASLLAPSGSAVSSEVVETETAAETASPLATEFDVTAEASVLDAPPPRDESNPAFEPLPEAPVTVEVPSAEASPADVFAALESAAPVADTAAEAHQAAAAFAEAMEEVAEDATDPAADNPFAATAPQGFSQATQPAREVAEPILQIAASDVEAFCDFCEAIPRVPAVGCQNAEVCCSAASPEAQAYPDEYICDGGDRDHPVHYFGGEMQGLDTEDTIAEFRDQNGKTRVQPSNSVCVYAPRFGAVRTISGPGVDIKVDKAAGATEVAMFDALHKNEGAGENRHESRVLGVATRNSASGMDTALPAQVSAKADGAQLNAKIDQGLEARTRHGLSLLETSDVFELSLQIVEPGRSSVSTGSVTAKSSSQATQTYSTFRVQAVTGSEEGGRPGKIRLIKEASPRIAKAGDVITFTIRFRNTGDYPVSEVRIMDNLTPRLTYIDGSGQVEVDSGTGGKLTVVPNREGSQVLIFELDEPLGAGNAGSITFTARVL